MSAFLDEIESELERQVKEFLRDQGAHVGRYELKDLVDHEMRKLAVEMVKFFNENKS